MRFAVAAIAALIPSCSTSPGQPQGKLVIAMTVDWEGAFLSQDGLDAIDDLRKTLGAPPITHFVSAAYFTKPQPDPKLVDTLVQMVHPEDELALHLHAWQSLVRKSGVTVKTAPSFLTGTDQLMEFEDGDRGFDTDLDAYTARELRAQIATSKALLATTNVPLAPVFRAGGYLATPKVQLAIREEGFTIDSSATDYRQLDEQKGTLPARIHEVWPNVTTTTQPFYADLGEQLLEIPVAAIADYVEPKEVTALFDSALAELAKTPERDFVVVLGFHQETAQEFAVRLVAPLQALRTRTQNVMFTTVGQAAERVRASLSR